MFIVYLTSLALDGYTTPPPPPGYPMNDRVAIATNQQTMPIETKNRGDNFWKGWWDNFV